MRTKEEVVGWASELYELAESFGEGDKTAWLMAYSELKQKVLDGCSLGRYANGLLMSDLIIDKFYGYEYLAILFAKMKILDAVIRGQIEEEND